MERDCQETVLNCGIVVKHPDPYDGAEFVASSGQGIVFIAYDYEKAKQVIIKKTKYDLCDIQHLPAAEQLEKYEFAKNVYREFELGIFVKHKHIMRVLDAYTPDANFLSFKSVYLVFELMNLRDLRHFHSNNWGEICDHQKGAPLIADFMLQLFSAIAYLHQDKLKLIHRDIKPDNIFIKEDDDHNYVLKLGDLGHARKIPPPEGPPMTLGRTTCQYRAPEIMNNKRYSTPADIWSAGCVLAEILIPANPLQPLFNSNDPQEVSKMHCDFFVGTATTISTKFSNVRLPQWRDIEKWGEYFRYILDNTLKLEAAERITAAEVLEINPYEMLNMEKYTFEEVTVSYAEPEEDLRRPVNWRMKIYDKLKEYSQKRFEEISHNHGN